MIHVFLWMAHHWGLSFALFCYLLIAVVLWSLGPGGWLIGAAVSVVSVVWWVAPQVLATAASLAGISVLIVGAIGVVVLLIRRALPTRMDRYRAAVKKGTAAQWMATPTVGERITARLTESLPPIIRNRFDELADMGDLTVPPSRAPLPPMPPMPPLTTRPGGPPTLPLPEPPGDDTPTAP